MSLRLDDCHKGRAVQEESRRGHLAHGVLDLGLNSPLRVSADCHFLTNQRSSRQNSARSLLH